MAATCGKPSRVRRPKNQADHIRGTRGRICMTRNQTIATLFAFVTTAVAFQTSPSLAFSSEAQQMCSGDAMRLCSSEIPDIPRIRACMVRNKANVSPGCRAVMDREAAAAAAARKREATAQ
ncbi:hypothetical protein IVB18_07200 [Bradyrhizobium sp. 186]|nr:hypothetical protein [Bradyrhizobium sp. 186]UPK37100.1 hypothetical protein IVB18_07200 [Bradyrhizobium sp. 186]